MYIRCLLLVPLILSPLSSVVYAQEPQTLIANQSIERDIAGGQEHKYSIAVQSGQFLRIVLNQKAIDVALTLEMPDGTKSPEVNLTRSGGMEVLSSEAASSGDYHLTIRAMGPAILAGSYEVRLEMKAAATTQDRHRMTAEGLLVEVTELRRQVGKTSEQRVEKLQSALAVWRELDDKYWASWSLFNIGAAFADLGRYEQAIVNYEQALTAARDVKDQAGEGDALNSMGNAYRNLGRYEKAIGYLEQSLAIRRELKDRGTEGVVLMNLGNVYNNLSRYEKAIDYYEQSLSIFRELKNRFNEGTVLITLGNANYNLTRYEKAIEYLQEALRIKREVKDRANEAFALNNLAGNYFALGYPEKAIECSEQALMAFREVKNRAGESFALNNLGQFYRIIGRYEKGIEYYEQALSAEREVKNPALEATTLMNLGSTYTRLGRYEKAIEYLEKSLAIRVEVKDRDGEGGTLIGLGNVYNLVGQSDKAVEYFEKSRAIAREVKNKATEGVALSDLGDAFSRMRRYDKATEYYEQALVSFREEKNRSNEANTLASLGYVYRNLGRLEKAIEHFEQALVIRREVKDPVAEASTLYEFAQTQRAQGNLLAARTNIEESLKISESLRSDLLSPDSRASYLAAIQGSYRLYIELLMRQHLDAPIKGFDALAVEVSERQRARSLLEMLAEARAEVRQGVDVALLDRERALSMQLDDKAGQMAKTPPERATALKQEINRLEIELERSQAAIRKNSPHYAALMQPQPLKLKEIQQQLDPDVLLLEYSLGEERSYLWSITRDSLSSYELPGEEQIKQSASQVYRLLTARSGLNLGESDVQRRERISHSEAELPAVAQSLSQMLLAPVVKQLSNKRLVIVADGALQYIPFAMLPEPSLVSSQVALAQKKRSGITDRLQPLIVNHEVVSVPSASALAIQRAELADRQLAPKQLAVIADPVFDRSDERFKSLNAASIEKEQVQPAAFSDTRIIEHLSEKADDKSGVAINRLVIPRLPFTREEANQLLALVPKTSSLSATDFQASRATVLSGELSQYRYIHFATHGWLDSERPGLSALVLSMVDQQGKPEDGFLRANDIYNLKLPAELVVLSACQTGLGKEIKGEGLVGLTRGFMYAGAARVVVSLWSVNDKATADLMTRFYEKMLTQQQRPAAALRAAQVEMWKQKQWRSPYYWAAFTLQGEWR